MPNPIPASLGLPPQDVLTVLEAASRAPSVHNSQPWRFRVMSTRLEVHADSTRRLPVADPEDKELRLACGAALMNMRIALESWGIRPLVSLLPAGHDSDLLAVVRYGGHVTPSAHMSELRKAIGLRRTNRKPFRDIAVPGAHVTALSQAAHAERSWLHVVHDRTQRARLQSLIHQAHQAQLDNPDFRAEFRLWSAQAEGQEEGVPLASAGPAPEPQDEWVLRDYAAGMGQPRVAGKDFEGEPLLLVVCSYFDSKLAEIQAGQALQRVLLTATALGLSTSFLAQPIEVPLYRKELRRLIGQGLVPQTILRIGFGSPVPQTPRRPLSDVVMAEPVAHGNVI